MSLIIFLYFLFNPHKFEKVCSMVWWALSYVKKTTDYRAIKGEIQSKINSFVGNLESKTSGTFPAVSLKWTARDEKERIDWEDGEAIIVMRDRGGRNKNFVHAAYLFTSEALLKKSKIHLSKTQKTSVDLFATHKLLEAESSASVQQFMSDYFQPQVTKSDDVRGLVRQFKHINRIGAFFPILIQELNCLGDKIFLSKPTGEVIEEVKSLINFLERFSERDVGDINVPAEFIGKYTRCAIKIVASKALRDRGDITVHHKVISDTLSRGFENVYVIGDGQKQNMGYMNKVVNSVLNGFPDVQLIKNYQFPGQIRKSGRLSDVKTYLACLRNQNAVKHLYEDNDIESLV